jgi:hypothetical protein
LTEGFLRGWLTFDSKTTTSPLREEYLLSVLERHLLLDVTRTKLGAVASIVGGNPSRQNVNNLSSDLKEHFELTLPYLSGKTRIRSNQTAAQTNDPAFWRKLLDKKKEELVSVKESAVELIPLEPETIG